MRIASSGVFTGDTFGLAHPELQIECRRPFLTCTTSPAAFEREAMVWSIEQVMELQPKTLYFTHYGLVEADGQSVAGAETNGHGPCRTGPARGAGLNGKRGKWRRYGKVRAVYRLYVSSPFISASGRGW